jgi:hypothetical protein
VSGVGVDQTHVIGVIGCGSGEGSRYHGKRIEGGESNHFFTYAVAGK